jgi:cytochrome c7-like protein
MGDRRDFTRKECLAAYRAAAGCVQMEPLFRRRVELGVKLALLALLLATVGAFVLAVALADSYQEVGEPVAQPIPFSHKHHVGDDGIDCRYCHTTVEKTAFAGMPSTQVCLTCHSQLFAQAGILQQLRDSMASGQPIAWKRVHYLPEFVYFDHSIHVNKGVACAECHGRVDQMPLTWRVRKLQMDWCIGCHRDPAPHLHPHDQVFAMPPVPLGDGDVRTLARALHIQDPQRLTDCSTCHR